jgi:cytidine deaminase
VSNASHLGTPSKADLDRLLTHARAVRSRAYAPYSKYRVGAAVLTRSGHVFAGCNVENSTFGATICAERSAVSAMVAAGHLDLVACAVVTAGPRPGSPCGICRQVLSEFARDIPVVLAAEDDTGRRKGLQARRTVRLAMLLPLAFRLADNRSEPSRPARKPGVQST